MAGRSAAIKLSPSAPASVASSASAPGSAESTVPLRRVGLAKGLGLRAPPGVRLSARRVERVSPPAAAAAVGESSAAGSARRGTLKRLLRCDSAEGERMGEVATCGVAAVGQVVSTACLPLLLSQ